MFTKKTTQIGEFLTPLEFLWFESVQFVLQKSTKETKKVLHILLRKIEICLTDTI